MNSAIQQLNKVFESRVRLGIMSALSVQDALDFNSLKETLDVTDGNLASHIASLEEEGYVKVKKAFAGKKTRTTYSVTASGKRAFADHLDALEQLIRQSNKRG